jgi:hypothetical protein
LRLRRVKQRFAETLKGNTLPAILPALGQIAGIQAVFRILIQDCAVFQELFFNA